jgi:hypothetical protein
MNATMIGRRAGSARPMERSGSASRICCRGPESERILSLPVVERPEEEREGNLSEVGCAVKERVVLPHREMDSPRVSLVGIRSSLRLEENRRQAARRDYALLFRMSPGAS